MKISSDARSYYGRPGGEPPLRSLVQHFYRHMDKLEESRAIRAMHAADLSLAENKLFMFLSGWLGGPPLYTDKFGHPRLRMRHLPFTINESARDQWMMC
ncbi:MAG: group II truncated hemoglobin [Mariprofundaceae bacterium]|nr:group II truncated hemoglobin [Mariprofundaceae bacterium]